jgi:predicted ester cyclase
MLFLPTIVEHRSTVEDIVGDCDRIAARVTIHGKQVGEFMGLQASGKEFTMQEIMIAEFRDGKISQIWRVADVFSMMQQLGALPSGIAGSEMHRRT